MNPKKKKNLLLSSKQKTFMLNMFLKIKNIFVESQVTKLKRKFMSTWSVRTIGLEKLETVIKKILKEILCYIPEKIILDHLCTQVVLLQP